jgi:signal transduction histidine kinase/ligand-binding sensor domain-containing protein
MKKTILFLACTFMMWCSCDDHPGNETVNFTSRVVDAREKTTAINAGNAPDTLDLLPEKIVPAPVFTSNNIEKVGEIAHFTTFTTEDGLPMDDVMSGTPDGNGMLWFGTNGGGITRYDGHSFTNYSTVDGLPDNVILSIYSDSKRNVWIGTSTGGLSKFDGRCFTTIPLNDATGLTRGITGILEDKRGAMWFGTRGRGIYKLDATGLRNYSAADGLSGDFIRSLSLGADGSIWVSTLGGVSSILNDRVLSYYTGDNRSLQDVSSLICNPDGTIWLGHKNGGITTCRLNIEGALFRHYPDINGFVPEIYSLESAENNGVWLSTLKHGAMLIQPDGEGIRLVKHFNLETGLSGNEVLCVTSDARGDLWFGMRGSGLCHYRGDAFTSFTGFRPISLAESADGILYVGTSLGIARREDGYFREWYPGNGFDSWTYDMSVDAQGRIGFSENVADLNMTGFSKIQGNQALVTGVNSKSVDIFWSMHDRYGNLWLAGRRGVEKWGKGKCVIYHTRQGLGNINALSLIERRDGSIWAGTDGGGISRIKEESVTTWTTDEGLPNNVAWCLTEDASGTLWIATLGGLCRYDGESFLNFTAQQGLPDNNIHQLLITHNGELNIGTLRGMAILKGWKDEQGKFIEFNHQQHISNKEIERYTPVMEVYNSANGYPIKDVQNSEHAIFEDHEGIIWIATGNSVHGLVRFDRKAIRQNNHPPTIQLLNVSLNNEPVCWYHLAEQETDSTTLAQQEIRVFGKALSPEERAALIRKMKNIRISGIQSHFPVPEELILDHRNNRIGFDFVAIETSRPEIVEYQFMLEGYDQDWSKPSRKNAAAYGNIYEGSYTFKVKAKSPDGIWSSPLEYRFVVLPPWYRSWWAYLLYAVLAGIVFLVYTRIRLSTLRRQKEKLERTVAERTEELQRKKQEADQQRERAEFSERVKEQFLANMSHEIRTPMNAIAGMSEILRNRPHAPEQAKYLNAIAQSSENLMVIVNDILDLTKIEAGKIQIESVPFSPHDVLHHVKEILQFKADEKGIALILDIAADVPQQFIGDSIRLNQIITNLGGNAIKFTEKGSVSIVARCERRGEEFWLVVQVTDTGIGIPEDRLDKIFEEFTQAYSDTTRKYGGTGLGLTISRRLAEIQGGNVKVSSERGKGSTFTVSIPYRLV